MAGDLGLPLLDLRLLAVPVVHLGVHERRVVAGIEDHRLVVHVHDVGADVVEEAVVVGDDDRRALVGVHQELLQPADGEDVEVVGGLVEEQHVGLGGEHLGEQHAQLEAAGEGREQVAVDLGRDAEPFEHLARPGFQGIAVVAEDQVLHLGVAVGVEFRLGVGEQALLLDHRLPDVVVAHHGDFQDGHVLVAEVVLLEDAQLEALGHRDRPLAGDVVPGEDAQKGRFTRAVGPHEAIAVAGVELDRHPLEQGLGAEGLTKVGDGDHRAENDNRIAGAVFQREGAVWAAAVVCFEVTRGSE